MTVTSVDGTQASATKFVHVTPSPCFAGGGANQYTEPQNETIVQESGNDISSVQLFPNPFQKQIHLTIPREYKKHLSYSIKDTKGTLIVSKQNINSNESLINLENLSAGVYFIVLQDESKTIVQKIIKQ